MCRVYAFISSFSEKTLLSAYSLPEVELILGKWTEDNLSAFKDLQAWCRTHTGKETITLQGSKCYDRNSSYLLHILSCFLDIFI